MYSSQGALVAATTMMPLLSGYTDSSYESSRSGGAEGRGAVRPREDDRDEARLLLQGLLCIWKEGGGGEGVKPSY